MMPPPILKLWEPPLDYGEENDDDEPPFQPESRQAVFFVCLMIGATIAATIWIAAACFVSETR